ncbi:hypothetical protein DXG03_006757, partial [Asterophora parasitica]
MKYLDSLIPLNIPNRTEVVKLYNSVMPTDYRSQFLLDMISRTTLRIGVATDTCTYGLDISNLRRVVLFDLCPSPENLKQKIGQLGRDDRSAEAITFAAAWVRETPGTDASSMGKQAAEDLRRRENLPPVT